MITRLVTWPLAPAFALIRVAEFLRDRAEEELYDPVRIRRELEDVAAGLAAGEISEEEAAAREEALLDRLLRAPRR